jgi:hypothetical protein
MKSLTKLVAFAKTLMNDTRGEDYANTTASLSTGARTVIAGTVIAASAGGATVAANNANKQTDTTSQKVNAAGGAQSTTTQAAQSPFANPGH